MGIINCSPESFFSASYTDPSRVYNKAVNLLEAGADIIDIGARSTALNAPEISVQDEKERMKNALRELSGSGITISIDTMYPDVLEACLRYDIDAINDIHGLADPKFGKLVGDSGLPAFLMAAFSKPGDPKGLSDTITALKGLLKRAQHFGVKEIILDPAIGRWTQERNADDDWEICRNFSQFLDFSLPLLIAVSRKSFIGDLLNNSAEERLSASLAVTYSLLEKGGTIVRTHDVSETRDIIEVYEKIKKTEKII